MTECGEREPQTCTKRLWCASCAPKNSGFESTGTDNIPALKVDNLREPRELPDEFKTVVEAFLPVLNRLETRQKDKEDEDGSAE